MTAFIGFDGSLPFNNNSFQTPPTTTAIPDPVKTPAAQTQIPSPTEVSLQADDVANLNSLQKSNLNNNLTVFNADGSPSPVVINGTATNDSDKSDTRIRLRAQRGAEGKLGEPGIYGDPGDSSNILKILFDTDGLLFPYTPTIAVGQQVNYNDVDLVHSNGDIMTYKNTPSVTLNVTGKFTVQNQREGQYALAVLHFLRTVSKMYFGEIDKQSGKAGLPPPVLVFRGYGNYMFNNLPVIVKSHSYTFDENMDMIEIGIGSDANNNPTGIALLPPMFQVTVDMVVQQTPSAMRKIFSLDSFRTGALLKANNSTGWI
jgi:hypothetical protein